MRQRMVWLLNGGVALVTLALIFTHFAQPPQNQNLPESAAPTAQPIVALVFLTYPGEGSDVNASLHSTAVVLTAHPVDQNQQLNTSTRQTLGSQPARTMCEADQLVASPNGKYLLIQYNCEAALFAVLQNLATGVQNTLARGYFLDWSPDGDWLLFRQTDNDEIWLIPAATSQSQPLPHLPPGTYNAAFYPDGQR